jgi:ABC-type glycerol-3-phosphate transport system substrate-binding protein
MSDKSLPKPVPPKDPVANVGNAQQPMLSSARVNVPVGGKPLVNNPPPANKPPQAIPVPTPAGKPPAMRPPTGAPPGSMRPPALSGKPLPGQPPQPSATPAAPATPGSPATPQPAPAGKATTPAAESPVTNQDSKQKKSPAFANVKNSPFKFLPYLVGAVVLVGIISFVIRKVTGNKTTSVAPEPSNQPAAARKTVPEKQTTLTYWGLWEPNNVVSDVLTKFEEANPGVKVNYVKQSHKDYRERLQTAVASGNGPDAFRFHASWASMLKEELAAMPQSIMSAKEYQETFYPTAAFMLSINGQIVGIPLMYDGLGLYYNKEMLTAANSEPPSTWAEVKTLASKLTVNAEGEIKRGGMAIGNASNVEHFADILGLLMLQNGADPSNPSSKEAQDALSFYTNFVNEDKVWSDKLPSSTAAFARGDAAMMLAPSWRVHEINALNPNLDFGIAPVPRLGEERLSWASYWAEGVSVKSSNKDQAWELLKFLSSQEIQRQLHSSQSQVRAFGEIYSRQDLANELASNELVAPFLQDAPSAQGWYLSSYTHDNGINDLLIKYYEDAINAVLSGKSVEDALTTVTQGTQQILRQYGVE